MVVLLWHAVWDVAVFAFALAVAPMTLHLIPPILGLGLIAGAVGSVALVLGGFVGMGFVLRGDSSSSAWIAPTVMNVLFVVALIAQGRSVMAAVLALTAAFSVSAGMWLRLNSVDRRFSAGRLALAGTPAAILAVTGAVFIALGVRYYSIETDALLPEIRKSEIVVSVTQTGPVRAGELVVVEDPEIQGRTLIRRVSATGGQTTTTRDGKSTVVGSNSAWLTSAAGSGEPDSSDFGAVPISAIKDRVVAVIWPAPRVRLIERQ